MSLCRLSLVIKWDPTILFITDACSGLLRYVMQCGRSVSCLVNHDGGSKFFFPKYYYPHIRPQNNATYQTTTKYHLSDYNSMQPARLQHNATYRTTTHCHLPDHKTMPLIRLHHNAAYHTTTHYHLSPPLNTIPPIKLQYIIACQITVQCHSSD